MDRTSVREASFDTLGDADPSAEVRSALSEEELLDILAYDGWSEDDE